MIQTVNPDSARCVGGALLLPAGLAVGGVLGDAAPRALALKAPVSPLHLLPSDCPPAACPRCVSHKGGLMLNVGVIAWLQPYRCGEQKRLSRQQLSRESQRCRPAEERHLPACTCQAEDTGIGVTPVHATCMFVAQRINCWERSTLSQGVGIEVSIFFGDNSRVLPGTCQPPWRGPAMTDCEASGIPHGLQDLWQSISSVGGPGPDVTQEGPRGRAGRGQLV